MDVHRSRFVPYPTFPITALAFSTSSYESQTPELPQPALKLAIGRQNGDIEIWNPLQGLWLQEAVFPGDNKSIDGLAWTREPDERDSSGQVVLGEHRLFSIASSPAVTEWDLEQGLPKKRSTGNFTEVWCFAAQPRQSRNLDTETDAESQDLVAGCGDGAIVLLSTAENDLTFKRFLARVSGKKAKCVSIAYQNQHRVLAGFMDSTIRVFDSRNGTNVRTMNFGTSLPGAPKNTIVWQVRCLPNGDIVSGDSNGEVVFWDGKSYTLSQRIKGHDSECLDLVASADGKTVFSGSNDGRLAIYRRTTNPTGRDSWAKVHHKRIHTGQVKSMSAFDSNGLSIVVSGGSDHVPIVTPMREYGREHHRSLPILPHEPPISSARHARLLVSWWDKSISIWRMARRSAAASDSDLRPTRRLVSNIVIDTKDNIRSVSISDDGRVLAASTSSEVKVFELRRRPGGDALAVRKLHVPKTVGSSGARMLMFSPDGKWLSVVSLDNEVHVVRLAPVPSKPKHLEILAKVIELERLPREDTVQLGFTRYGRTISQAAFASDSSVFVCGDLSGYLDSWVLEGHEDLTAPAIDVSKPDRKQGSSDDSSDDSSDEDDEVCVFYGQHWTDNPAGHLLPRLDSAPLVLSFRPTVDSRRAKDVVNGNPGVHSTRHNPHAHSHELPRGKHHLWIMSALHKVYEFDVLAGRLSDWGRQAHSTILPQDFKRMRERVKGAVWDVGTQRERIWLYGSTWMFMLNVGPGPRGKRRKREADGLPESKRQKLNGSRTIPSRLQESSDSIMRDDDAATDISQDGEEEVEDEENERDDDDDDDDEDQMPDLLALAHSSQLITASKSPREPQYWCTFKYRPILGVGLLESEDASTKKVDGDDDDVLEVVVVERPLGREAVNK